MERKDLKFYETPAMEVVELKAQSALLAGSGPSDDDEKMAPSFEPEPEY